MLLGAPPPRLALGQLPTLVLAGDARVWGNPGKPQWDSRVALAGAPPHQVHCGATEWGDHENAEPTSGVCNRPRLRV